MLESVRRPPIHRRVPLRRRANRIPPAIVPTMHDDDDDVSVVPTAPWLVHENRHGGRFRRRGGSGGSGDVPSMSMLTSFHSSSFARSTLFLAINDRCYDPDTLTIGAFSKSRRMLDDDDKDNRGGAKAGAG